MLFILVISVVKKAFIDYTTIDELVKLILLDEEMYRLQWDENIVDLPLFESMSGKASPGQNENGQLSAVTFETEVFLQVIPDRQQ
jgi:hypothetical protein